MFSTALEKVSLSDLAYTKLREEILSLRLSPGTQALEENLAQLLGMSRTPVREAAIRLQSDGLLEIIPRKGIRVAPLSRRDVKEINQVLSCLEAQAAECLALRQPSQDDVNRLRETIAAMDLALQQKDVTAWNQADYCFHRLLVELCGNRQLTEVGRNYLDKAHRCRLLTTQIRATPNYSNLNHAAVVEAIAHGDARAAWEIHLAHKRRWEKELAHLLEQLDLAD